MKTESKIRLIIDAWANTDPLTINQAAALWIGESPPQLSWDSDFDKYPIIKGIEDLSSFEHIRNELCLAVNRYLNIEQGELNIEQSEPKSRKKKLRISENQKLEPTDFLPSNDFDENGRPTGQINETYPDPDRTTVSRENLAKWAMANHHSPIFLEKEITNLLPYKDRHPDIPPYLNPEHEYYSIELAAAIEAWSYVFDENNLKKGMTPKQQLTKYLTSNFGKKFTVSMIDKVASVANPTKNGGTPTLS